VHSFYIGWATDAGVIGLIFLGAAILGSIIQHLSLVRRSSRSVVSAPIWQGLIAGFVGYFVYTASSPDQYSQLPYIMIALMGSFAYAVRHDVPEDSASPTEAVGASSSPNRLVPRLGLVTSVRSRE
jgi:O-antigen ligase